MLGTTTINGCPGYVEDPAKVAICRVPPPGNLSAPVHHTKSVPAHRPIEIEIVDQLIERPPLKEHQQKAINRYVHEKAVALFHEQGTGKTRTALELLQRWFVAEEIKAAIIIAPNNVHLQWARQEIPKWLQIPYEVVTVGGSSHRKQRGLTADPKKLQIVVSNIDTFSKAENKIADIVQVHNALPTAIVLDEATSIKRIESKRTQNILYGFSTVIRRGKSIVGNTSKSAKRVILTGTPITNGSFDVWSLFEFVQPGYWGMGYRAFQQKFAYTVVLENRRNQPILLTEKLWNDIKTCETYQDACTLRWGDLLIKVPLEVYEAVRKQTAWKGPYKNVDLLMETMNKVADWVKIADCEDMPDQIEYTRTWRMEPAQQQVYDQMVTKLIAEYQGKTLEATSKMVAMLRLAQISNGFLSTDWECIGDENDPNDYDIRGSKDITWFDCDNKMTLLLADIAEALEEDESPVIICTRFTAEAELLYVKLSEKYSTSLQTGWRKEGTIEQFQKGQFQVMVANTRVISKGFNLQNSHRMYFYSNSMSLEDRLQVMARTYRMGQKEKCLYYDYVNEDTVDLQILGSLRAKKDLFEYIRDKSIEQLLGRQT